MTIFIKNLQFLLVFMIFIIFQTGPHWTSLGSKINGEPKLATQLPKGCMILCVKKHFHEVLYVLARGGDNDDFY